MFTAVEVTVAAVKIEPFEMERWQSLHEHEVELNLSDSGVHPLSLRELLALFAQGGGEEDALEDLLSGPAGGVIGSPRLWNSARCSATSCR